MIYAVSCTKSSGLFFGADLGKTAPKSAEKMAGFVLILIH